METTEGIVTIKIIVNEILPKEFTFVDRMQVECL